MIIKKLRGMKDYLYKDMELFTYIENICRQILFSYGFNQINTPILENTQLFNKSIGQISDIVKKEMYTFVDLHNTSISMRPECTVSCIRLLIENNLYKTNKFLKLWYSGPMFRYERPQKGRFRQFYQIGAEVFGSDQPNVESELILIIKRIFTTLKVDTNKIILHINSIGNFSFRETYKNILKDYLKKFYKNFNKNIQYTINNNPLRIFDSKNNNIKNILLDAPKITDYLEEIDKLKFNTFKNFLKELNIDFVVDKYLVRGLDYYSGNVFEWKIKQNDLTICAGGRYDNLVQIIHPKNSIKLPAVGFAIGIDRLMSCFKFPNILNRHVYKIYFLILDNTIINYAFKIAEDIRNKFTNKDLQILIINNFKSLKKQISYANKKKIDLLIIIGPEEIKNNLITVKLLDKNLQYKIKVNDFFFILQKILDKKKIII